ncbi:inorganic phosphate transporter, partial [Klebsiella variicola]|uniref:inorganic phosphate transporter n=1 Tax=Klebsiella variicola TaxID=244366 RepID=UPI0039C37177
MATGAAATGLVTGASGISSSTASPFWVILAVALALGLGTMVGWKRVVLTIGEKIGKQGMTYAQGMSAQ